MYIKLIADHRPTCCARSSARHGRRVKNLVWMPSFRPCDGVGVLLRVEIAGFRLGWASEMMSEGSCNPLQPLSLAGLLSSVIPCGDQLPRCRLNVRWHDRRALKRTRWLALSSFRYIDIWLEDGIVSKGERNPNGWVFPRVCPRYLIQSRKA
jgi:hypothetical protein